MRALLNVPFFVILMGIAATAMLVPAAHGWAVRDWQSARAFLYSGLSFQFLTAILLLTTYHGATRNIARAHLLALPGFFAGLPLMLAVPVREAVPDTTFLNAYWEMLSSLTTTGATLFDDPGRLPHTVHLWRALVGWFGGLFVWITAVAILAPMKLGGFEVLALDGRDAGARKVREEIRAVDPRERLLRYALVLTPVYAALTGALWALLLIAGEDPLTAICHAMSTMATSGISPVGGVAGGNAGLPGELFIFVFFIFAVTRMSFAADLRRSQWWAPGRDPELTMATTFVLLVPAFLFLRHWVGAYDVDEQMNFFAAVSALWGAVFSVLSFLTTTGFVSDYWVTARDWSGLQTPGLILMGLAVFGGGVATTAGGVKLLRVFALYQHGVRELERMIHPSSVGGAGTFGRGIRREGAFVAWVFFMLFALTIALVMSALALFGLDFETATIFTVASLSTTGPLAQVAVAEPLSYALLSEPVKLILAAAMVLGRLETLAVIALLNPEFWRG